jgi:hypothetical protein
MRTKTDALFNPGVIASHGADAGVRRLMFGIRKEKRNDDPGQILRSIFQTGVQLSKERRAANFLSIDAFVEDAGLFASGTGFANPKVTDPIPASSLAATRRRQAAS